MIGRLAARIFVVGKKKGGGEKGRSKKSARRKPPYMTFTVNREVFSSLFICPPDLVAEREKRQGRQSLRGGSVCLTHSCFSSRFSRFLATERIIRDECQQKGEKGKKEKKGKRNVYSTNGGVSCLAFETV